MMSRLVSGNKIDEERVLQEADSEPFDPSFKSPLFFWGQIIYS